jgi:hypothetical protein
MASLVISKWSKLHQGIFKIARDQGLGLLPTEVLHRNLMLALVKTWRLESRSAPAPQF